MRTPSAWRIFLVEGARIWVASACTPEVSTYTSCDSGEADRQIANKKQTTEKTRRTSTQTRQRDEKKARRTSIPATSLKPRQDRRRQNTHTKIGKNIDASEQTNNPESREGRAPTNETTNIFDGRTDEMGNMGKIHIRTRGRHAMQNHQTIREQRVSRGMGQRQGTAATQQQRKITPIRGTALIDCDQYDQSGKSGILFRNAPPRSPLAPPVPR